VLSNSPPAIVRLQSYLVYYRFHRCCQIMDYASSATGWYCSKMNYITIAVVMHLTEMSMQQFRKFLRTLTLIAWTSLPHRKKKKQENGGQVQYLHNVSLVWWYRGEGRGLPSPTHISSNACLFTCVISNPRLCVQCLMAFHVLLGAERVSDIGRLREKLSERGEHYSSLWTLKWNVR